MDVGGEFMQTIINMKDVTLFAPSNDAWNDPNLQNIIRLVLKMLIGFQEFIFLILRKFRNKEKMREILNLHVVRDRLNTERIRQSNANSGVSI